MDTELVLQDIVRWILFFVQERHKKNTFSADMHKIQAFFYEARDKFPILKGYLSFGDAPYPWSPQLENSLLMLELARVITQPDLWEDTYVMNPSLPKMVERYVEPLSSEDFQQLKEIAGEFAAKLGR